MNIASSKSRLPNSSPSRTRPRHNLTRHRSNHNHLNSTSIAIPNKHLSHFAATEDPPSPTMSSPEPAAALPPHPLLNRTYTLYTLTPLHAFPALTRSGLQPHARTLATQLRGDLLRGVTTTNGAGDATAPVTATAPDSTGRLKSCTWLPLPTSDTIATSSSSLSGIDGIEITVTFENITYSALLVRANSAQQQQKHQQKGFTHFPLLLTRMPRHIKSVLSHYLETTFDTVVTPLVLEEAFLRSGLEKWVNASVRGGRKAEVKLTFAHRRAAGAARDGGAGDAVGGGAGGVRNMGITIAARHVGRFARRGWWRCVGGYLKEVCGIDVVAGTLPEQEAEDDHTAARQPKRRRKTARHTPERATITAAGREVGGWELKKVICGGFVMQSAGDDAPGKWKGFEARGDAEGKVVKEIVEGLVKVAERRT